MEAYDIGHQVAAKCLKTHFVNQRPHSLDVVPLFFLKGECIQPSSGKLFLPRPLLQTLLLKFYLSWLLNCFTVSSRVLYTAYSVVKVALILYSKIIAKSCHFKLHCLVQWIIEAIGFALCFSSDMIVFSVHSKEMYRHGPTRWTQ